MTIQHMFLRLILLFTLLFPMLAEAHLLSIQATQPFPTTVAASSLTSATFTVTNISSKTNLTAINQSNFAANGPVSITSSTCGSVLTPGQFCTIQLSLQAPLAGKNISTALKIWAKPSLDGVQFPINIAVTASLPNFTLVPVDSTLLPALRAPIVATHSDNWLIVSGSLVNFHDFNNNFNTSLYVYNPSTAQMHTMVISSTNLPTEVIHQLASSDQEFLQDGDTLYIMGGYYTPDNTNFTTLNTFTAINVPGMINAILTNNTNLAPFVHYNTSIPQFKVTGGQLGKIGNDFYLAYGQDCEGIYVDSCSISQTYTNSIYQFSTDPTLSTITILNTVTHHDLDGSGWRRRDYTLTPFIFNNMETLFAMGGPFTPGIEADVWTNGILFNGDLQDNSSFINQQANQYLSPYLPMYSANQNISYVATFSGLSNLYWSTSGLIYDGTTPYGNILDLISADASGNVQEYANLQPMCSGQPLASCLYMGLDALFIPTGNAYDARYILQLDQLPQDSPTLVGYIYAGLVSPGIEIFSPPQSTVTNQIYAVYAAPAVSNTINWTNISNLYPGN